RTFARTSGAFGEREATIRLPEVAGAGGTRRRTSESQAAVSCVSRGRVVPKAKEAQALCAQWTAKATTDSVEPGMGGRFCARCDCGRGHSPCVQRSGCLHARVPGAGGGHRFCQPPCDTRAE